MKPTTELLELWHKTKHVHAKLGKGTRSQIEALAELICSDDWPDLYVVHPDGTDEPFC